jgi:tetratricopeptide (TPR) repeat protein
MNWRGRLERWLGYEPVGWSWRLYRVEEQRRRRSALPERIPVPRGELPRGSGLERIPHERVILHAGAFVRAHPKHPASPSLQLFLRKAPIITRVEAALRAQQWGEAERDLREVLDIDPQDARARFLVGVCRLRRGDLEGAGPCFEAAETAMRTQADFQAAYGGYWEARGDAARAQACYREALALEPGHAGALDRLAAFGEMVEIYLGTLDEPQKAYLPRADYENAIVRTWETSGCDGVQLLARSHEHLRLGQASLALKAADRALACMTGAGGAADAPATAHIEALAARARALLALERFDEATAAAEQLEDFAPDSEWTASCWGHILWFTGEREEAAAHIERALALDPNRVEDLLLYLRPEFPRVPQDAMRTLKQLESRHPQSYAVQSVMASVLMARGEWDEGAERAVACARLGAGDTLLAELTGRLVREGLHQDVRRVAAAAGGWRSLIGANPVLRSHLALSLDQCGEADAARELWASLVEDEGAHPELRLSARRALAHHA